MRLGLSENKQIGTLTERQRVMLASLLDTRCEPDMSEDRVLVTA